MVDGRNIFYSFIFIQVHSLFHQYFAFYIPSNFIFIRCLFHPHNLVFYSGFQISFHSFLLNSTFIWRVNFMVHWFHNIAYSVPFYDSWFFNFDFLLFSLIISFTAHSISHVISDIFLFHMPLDIYLHSLSIPFFITFHSISIPLNFSFHILFKSIFHSLFPSSVHSRQSPFHRFLHSISNPFSIPHYLTFPMPFQFIWRCVSLQFLIWSSKYPSAFSHNY